MENKITFIGFIAVAFPFWGIMAEELTVPLTSTPDDIIGKYNCEGVALGYGRGNILMRKDGSFTVDTTIPGPTQSDDQFFGTPARVVYSGKWRLDEDGLVTLFPGEVELEALDLNWNPFEPEKRRFHFLGYNGSYLLVPESQLEYFIRSLKLGPDIDYTAWSIYWGMTYKKEADYNHAIHSTETSSAE